MRFGARASAWPRVKRWANLHILDACSGRRSAVGSSCSGGSLLRGAGRSRDTTPRYARRISRDELRPFDLNRLVISAQTAVRIRREASPLASQPSPTPGRPSVMSSSTAEGGDERPTTTVPRRLSPGADRPEVPLLHWLEDDATMRGMGAIRGDRGCRGLV
jgi:hypothetical protein